jgi:hypothetical protein
MPFDWSAYLVLAEELATRTESEAALRSAISRAYYAVFGSAAGRLQHEGVALPRLAAHEAVWTGFRSHPRREWKNVGLRGDQLRGYRIRADYEATFRDLQPVAEASVTMARSVLAQIAVLPE